MISKTTLFLALLALASNIVSADCDALCSTVYHGPHSADVYNGMGQSGDQCECNNSPFPFLYFSCERFDAALQETDPEYNEYWYPFGSGNWHCLKKRNLNCDSLCSAFKDGNQEPYLYNDNGNSGDICQCDNKFSCERFDATSPENVWSCYIV